MSRIVAMLAAGTSYNDIQKATGCSRATVAKYDAVVARLIELRPPGGYRYNEPAPAFCIRIAKWLRRVADFVD